MHLLTLPAQGEPTLQSQEGALPYMAIAMYHLYVGLLKGQQ